MYMIRWGLRVLNSEEVRVCTDHHHYQYDDDDDHHHHVVSYGAHTHTDILTNTHAKGVFFLEKTLEKIDYLF